GTLSDPQSGVASLTSVPGGPIPVAADGSWSSTLTLSVRAHQVTFVAADNAGNQTIIVVTIMVAPDASPASREMALSAETVPAPGATFEGSGGPLGRPGPGPASGDGQASAAPAGAATASTAVQVRDRPAEPAGAEQPLLLATGSNVPPCPGDTDPSVAFDPVTTTVVAGVLVTLKGVSDPGEVWFWSTADHACDFRDKVTYAKVTVTLDDGQQIPATNLDAQWGTWSAAVTFQQAGTHTATAVALTTTGGQISGQVSVQVHPAGPTITPTSRLTSSTVDYPLTVQASATLRTSIHI